MTPQEIFDSMRARWLANLPTFDADSLADDVVIETPFAAPAVRRIPRESRPSSSSRKRAGRCSRCGSTTAGAWSSTRPPILR